MTLFVNLEVLLVKLLKTTNSQATYAGDQQCCVLAFLNILNRLQFLSNCILHPVKCYSFTPTLSSRDIMNNKVFYQHPNLMRVLGMHETVMEVMVNVLGGDKNKVCFSSG